MHVHSPCGGDGCSHEPPIRDFPASIRLALARAAACDGAGLEQLDAGERALLVRLVRNVSAAAPGESVRIANPTLATGLHVSERTIHRLKAGLEAKGWITRRQFHSRRRGMQISDVWLTRHALETLGFANSAIPAASPAPAAAQFQRPPRTADALLFPQSVSQRPPCGDSTVPSKPRRVGSFDMEGLAADRCASPSRARSMACAETWAVNETRARPDSPDGNGGIPGTVSERPAQQPSVPNVNSDLPDDVRVLADEGGVTVAGVRLLMGLTKKAGTRLGHVLQVAKDAVLGSRKPFAYMQKLLRTGKDWSALATTARRLQEEAKQTQAGAGDLEQLRAAMAEGLYSHAKREFVWRVEFAAVHQSTVEDAARGGIGRWLVLHDVSGLAAAWREGRIFRVEQATIEAWGRASGRELPRRLPAPAAIPSARGRLSPPSTSKRGVTAAA